VLVSEGGFVGSGDLRQMSEYPVPHGEHYHSYILRRWRPAFCILREIQIYNRADEQNALKIVSPSPTKVQTKQFHLRKPTNPWPMRKTHLTQS
jgi:hypothetical protein